MFRSTPASEFTGAMETEINFAGKSAIPCGRHWTYGFIAEVLDAAAEDGAVAR